MVDASIANAVVSMFERPQRQRTQLSVLLSYHDSVSFFLVDSPRRQCTMMKTTAKHRPRSLVGAQKGPKMTTKLLLAAVWWQFLVNTPVTAWLPRSASFSLPSRSCFFMVDNDQDPIDLQHTIRNLFRSPSPPREEPTTGDPAMGLNPLDIEDYFVQRGLQRNASLSTTTAMDTIDSDDNVPDTLFLDADEYVQSSQWVDQDGMLRPPLIDTATKPPEYRIIASRLLQQAPVSPTAQQPLTSLEELWATLQDLPKPDARQAEDLHRQVFREEPGYWNQSSVFRESLSDPTKSTEATRLRHSVAFRKRQQAALSSLEAHVQQFEQQLQQAVVDGRRRCSRCRCLLSEAELPMADLNHGQCQICYGEQLVAASDTSFRDEMRPRRRHVTKAVTVPSTAQLRPRRGLTLEDLTHRPPSRRTEKTVGGERAQVIEDDADVEDGWIEVEDPDTGEIFYVNKDTEEIRWEL